MPRAPARLAAVPLPSTPAVRDAALAAVAFAALTLPDPARMGPGRRHLLRLGSAAVTGWLGWRAAEDQDGVPFVAPSAFGAAAGAAAALALAPVEDATDRWLHGRLRRAGLHNPRPAMALAAAALGALALATDRRSGTQGEELVAVEDLYEERDLDPALRALIRAMLEAGDPAAVGPALAQLDGARAQALGDGFESTVSLVVDPDLPRVVPHTQAWPVSARWHIGEHPVVLQLQLHGGRLDHVALVPDEERYPDDQDPFEVTPVDDPDNTWPGPGEVTLTVETPEGVRSVT